MDQLAAVEVEHPVDEVIIKINHRHAADEASGIVDNDVDAAEPS